MKSYQVRFSDEALDDLGHIFAELLPVAGERVARDFAGRIEAACLGLAVLPERGSLRNQCGRGCVLSDTADRRALPLLFTMMP